MNLKDQFNSKLKGVEAYNKQHKFSKKHSEYLSFQGFFDEFVDFTNCDLEASGVFLIGNFFFAFTDHIGKYLEAKMYNSGLPNIKDHIDTWLDTGERLPVTQYSDNKHDIGKIIHKYRNQYPLINERFKQDFLCDAPASGKPAIEIPNIKKPTIQKPVEPVISYLSGDFPKTTKSIDNSPTVEVQKIATNTYEIKINLIITIDK